MKTSEYIQKLKTKLNTTKNRDIAKRLGVHEVMIGSYLKDETNFGPETALKIAKLLDLPPAKIATDMYAARAKYEKDRRAWTKAAASLCLAASVGIGTVAGGNVNAAALPSPAETAAHNVYM